MLPDNYSSLPLQIFNNSIILQMYELCSLSRHMSGPEANTLETTAFAHHADKLGSLKQKYLLLYSNYMTGS